MSYEIQLVVLIIVTVHCISLFSPIIEQEKPVMSGFGLIGLKNCQTILQFLLVKKRLLSDLSQDLLRTIYQSAIYLCYFLRS